METLSLLSEEYFRPNEQISVTVSHYLPTIERHRHDFYEIVYVTKGSGYHILNEKKFFISEGSMFLVTRGSVHGYYSDRNMEWVNIMFKPQAVNQSIIYTRNSGDIITALLTTDLSRFSAGSQNASIQMIVKEMQHEYEGRRTGYQEILTGYLQVLLMTLFRATKEQNGAASGGESVRDLNLVDIVTDLLSRGEDASSEAIARKAFVSPRYFRELFKKESGRSLTEFKRRFKTEQAARLLAETDMPVSKIMEAVGMNDTKNFYAAFKTFAGMTPGEYRKKHC
ncbi:MAG: helix-turn-helix domain-containing protein [Clostridia bacterium]|nr:helix-turn-helix domain-containing protein [Clostridia bacterium]